MQLSPKEKAEDKGSGLFLIDKWVTDKVLGRAVVDTRQTTGTLQTTSAFVALLSANQRFSGVAFSAFLAFWSLSSILVKFVL